MSNNGSMGLRVGNSEKNITKHENVESPPLLENEFIEGIISILDSDKKIRNNFLSSSKRALREIAKLKKKEMLPPILTGEMDETDNHDSDFYKSKMDQSRALLKDLKMRAISLTGKTNLVEAEEAESGETKMDQAASQLKELTKEWTNEIGRECVETMVELLTPFYGFSVEEEEKPNQNNIVLDPDGTISAYKDTLDKMGSSVKLAGISNQFVADVTSAGLYGYAGSAASNSIELAASHYVALERYFALSQIQSLPTIVGGIFFVKEIIQSVVRNVKEVKSRVKQVVIGKLHKTESIDGRRAVDELLYPDVITGFRAECFEELLTNREKGVDGQDSVGLEILSKMFDLKDEPESRRAYLHEVWQTNDGKVSEVLDIAENLSNSIFEDMLTLEKVINRKKGLVIDSGERAEHALIKEEYRIQMSNLTNILDNALIVDKELHDGNVKSNSLSEAVVRKSMLYMTRRNFLKGAAVGIAATAMYGIYNRFGGPLGQSSEVNFLEESLESRPMVAEHNYRLSPDIASSIIMNTIKDAYNIEYDFDDKIVYPTSIEEKIGTINWLKDAGSQLLQIHPSLYFNELEDKSVTYEEFLEKMYFPHMFAKAKEIGIDINTLLGITRISSENVTSEERQNEDVKQGRIQMILGALGWYMHREYGTDLPIDTIKSATYDMLGGPYDTARLNGQVTLGIHDVELSEYAKGVRELGTTQLNYVLDYPNQFSAFDDVNQSREKVRNVVWSELRKNVLDFIYENGPDKIAGYFALLDDSSHEDWDSIGLGDDASFSDIVHQTTRYSRVWEQLCFLHGRDFDPSRIYSESFKNAREGFVAQGQISSPEDKVMLLIGDQISNKKFRDWMRLKSKQLGNVVGIEKIMTAYDHFEELGTYLRDDLATAYREVAPREYDWKFQLETGLGYIKSLEKEIERSDFLTTLAERFPLWKTFVATSVREIAPFPLLVEDPSGLPRMTEFDVPYNPRGVVQNLEAISYGLYHMFGEETPKELLRRTVELLRTRRYEPGRIPNYVTDLPAWHAHIEPYLKKLDLEHYSSMWRSIDVTATFLGI